MLNSHIYRSLHDLTSCIPDATVVVPSKSGLSMLSDAYTTLYHLQTEAHAPPAGCDDGTCMEVTESERENHASAVGDIMLHIAWQIVESPSQSWLDARAKAVVLLDWVGQDKDDVTDQLAASLSRDIIALFDALEPKPCHCPQHSTHVVPAQTKPRSLAKAAPSKHADAECST
jgi:hypothetical protein